MLKYVFIIKYNYSETCEYSYKTIVVHARSEDELVNIINNNKRLFDILEMKNMLINLNDLKDKCHETYKGIYENYYKYINIYNVLTNILMFNCLECMYKI